MSSEIVCNKTYNNKLTTCKEIHYLVRMYQERSDKKGGKDQRETCVFFVCEVSRSFDMFFCHSLV